MTASETKSKYPVGIFELIKKGSGSGFIKEDTVGTASPEEIVHPGKRSLINRSVVREKTNLDGKEVYVNVKTRYIYGCELIKELEQKQRGVVPNQNSDNIYFLNGYITVPKTGATVGLYEFMSNHAQNSTSENREHFEHLEAIFREIKPAENAQQSNDHEFIMIDAMSYIRDLVTQSGSGYSYSEERIDALCETFGVYAEDYESRIQALLGFAKIDPKAFLDAAKKTEQTVIIEIGHALKLGLITFEGNTAMYATKNEKIHALVGNYKNPDKKIAALGAWFQTVDGRTAYEAFKLDLSAMKEVALSQQ